MVRLWQCFVMTLVSGAVGLVIFWVTPPFAELSVETWCHLWDMGPNYIEVLDARDKCVKSIWGIKG